MSHYRRILAVLAVPVLAGMAAWVLATGTLEAACTAADSRIAYSSLQSTRTIFAVNPDGTCRVQLTSGGQSVPMAWTADNHLLLGRALLDVPDSTDASTVTTVQSYTRDITDISQHRDSTGILPAAQQLLLVESGPGQNLAACAADDTGCVQLTDYVDTFDGSDGIDFVVKAGQWLPPSSDRSRIRLTYKLQRAEYVAGTVVNWVEGHRVIGLDTAGWPSVSTAGSSDAWIEGNDDQLAGYPLSVYGPVNYSRDGTKAVLRGGDKALYTIPLIYDETLDTTSFDAANAVISASNVGETPYSDIALSPDNSQIAYNGSHLVGKGRNKTTKYSIWVIDAGVQSGSVEVDGTDSDSFCCTVWGPSASAPPPATGNPPSADAGGPYSGIEDAAVAFDGSGSTDPDGDSLSYTWDFGDGSTGSGVSPSHTYLWGGSFTISLTVSDGNGNSNTATSSVSVTEVNDSPVADAGGAYSGNVGVAVAFDGSGTVDYDNLDGTSANDQALVYDWDFGDGGTGYGVTPSHAYSAAGTYNVILTVTDGIVSDNAATTADIADVAADPSITGISPSSMSAGTSINATISGSAFQAGATVTFINGSHSVPSASNVSVSGDGSSISLTISVANEGRPGTRVWDVLVTNPDGGAATLVDGFTVVK